MSGLNDNPPPKSRALQFRRVTLRTPRLAAQREFYRSVLRLPETKQAADAAAFAAGATTLEFVHDDQTRSPLYHFAFNIPENQIQHCMDWAASKFELIRNPGTGDRLVHFPNWNAHSAYFYDPSGNLVEFIARHTLRNAREGAFEVPRDLLCVSEVGVVSEDVAMTDAELTEKLKVSRYGFLPNAKLPNDFRAMGDEHGLFIVVRHRRRWFMTETGAEPFAAAVTVEVDDPNLQPQPFDLRDTLCRVTAAR